MAVSFLRQVLKKGEGKYLRGSKHHKILDELALDICRKRICYFKRIVGLKLNSNSDVLPTLT
jgi:hypothetical protein